MIDAAYLSTALFLVRLVSINEAHAVCRQPAGCQSCKAAPKVSVPAREAQRFDFLIAL